MALFPCSRAIPLNLHLLYHIPERNASVFHFFLQVLADLAGLPNSFSMEEDFPFKTPNYPRAAAASRRISRAEARVFGAGLMWM